MLIHGMFVTSASSVSSRATSAAKIATRRAERGSSGARADSRLLNTLDGEKNLNGVPLCAGWATPPGASVPTVAPLPQPAVAMHARSVATALAKHLCDACSPRVLRCRFGGWSRPSASFGSRVDFSLSNPSRVSQRRRATDRSRVGVKFHFEQLEVAPGEGGEDLFRLQPFELASRTAVRVGAGRCRVLAVEGDRWGAVADVDAVALCGFRHQPCHSWEFQRGDVQVGIQAEVGTLGQSQRVERVTVRTLRGRGKRSAADIGYGHREGVVDLTLFEIFERDDSTRDRQRGR